MISVRNAYCGKQDFYSAEEAEAFCALVRHKSLYSGTQAHILAYYLYPEWRRGQGRAYEAKAREVLRHEIAQELVAIKAELAAMQRDYAARRIKAAASTAPALKYNPNQPRVPGGNENGGQWTSGEGELFFWVHPSRPGLGSGSGSGAGMGDASGSPFGLGGSGGGGFGGLLVAGIGSVIGQILGQAVRAGIHAAFGRKAKSTTDIITPGGKGVGTKLKKAGDGIQTVRQQEYNAIKQNLFTGAKEVPAPEGYVGKVFQRPDGTRFGIRISVKYGETIDIFNNDLIKRIHVR